MYHDRPPFIYHDRPPFMYHFCAIFLHPISVLHLCPPPRPSVSHLCCSPPFVLQCLRTFTFPLLHPMLSTIIIYLWWYTSFTTSYLLPETKAQVKGNNDINISIVKRDQFSKPEIDLFKTLFFNNQVHSFSYSNDGSTDQEADCYDDRLPTNIIIHKGNQCQESPKDYVEKLRQMNYLGPKDLSYSLIDELALFGYDVHETTEDDAIRIQSLQRKVIKNSMLQFLDKFNDLVYVVNGTEMSG